MLVSYIPYGTDASADSVHFRKGTWGTRSDPETWAVRVGKAYGYQNFIRPSLTDNISKFHQVSSPSFSSGQSGYAEYSTDIIFYRMNQPSREITFAFETIENINGVEKRKDFEGDEVAIGEISVFVGSIEYVA